MIEIQDLHKSFGKNKVLKGVNISIPQGGITAVLGPNGSGKTTILKTLLGLVIPDRGKLKWHGKDLDLAGEYRSKVGYLPQIARFPENLKVDELLSMITDLRGQPGNAQPLIDLFDLQSFRNQPLQNLSGGTRQKINTVLTFMFDNDLFILDEPTAGLDPVSLIKLKEMILQKSMQGKTILLTTHILSLVEELASEIIFLLDGRIYYQGSVEELKEQHHESGLEAAIAKILSKEAPSPSNLKPAIAS